MDLSQLKFVDSSGLRMLMILVKEVGGQGKELIVELPKPSSKLPNQLTKLIEEVFENCINTAMV